MFGKLCLLILAMGATACGLLAMRQARLQAGHELAEARLRIAEHDARLLELRARIAERINPEALHEELDRMGVAREAFRHAAEAGSSPPTDEELRQRLIERLLAE